MSGKGDLSVMEELFQRIEAAERKQKEHERLLKTAEKQILKLRKKLNNRRWVKKRFAEYSG